MTHQVRGDPSRLEAYTEATEPAVRASGVAVDDYDDAVDAFLTAGPNDLGTGGVLDRSPVVHLTLAALGRLDALPAAFAFALRELDADGAVRVTTNLELFDALVAARIASPNTKSGALVRQVLADEFDELLADPATTPADVRAFWDALTDEHQDDLVDAAPMLVGNADGVPPPVRYEANRLSIEREVDRLDEERAALVAEHDRLLRERAEALDEIPGNDLLSQLPGADIGIDRWLDLTVGDPDDVTRQIAALDGTAIALGKLLADDPRTGDQRQILVFDPRDDGRVAEVFGDLTGADNVAVLVPGTGTDLDNFTGGRDNENAMGGVAARADDLHAQMNDRAPDAENAVVAWLDWDAPDGVVTDATFDHYADDAEADLLGLDGALAVEGVGATTYIGHSYGSLVVGETTKAGLVADDLVFVGSPGVGGNSESELGVDDGTTVWAARADGDPIAYGRDITDIFDPVLPGGDGEAELWFGRDPAEWAQRFTTAGSHGHDEYFLQDSDALQNLAYIATQQDDLVTLVE